MECSEFYVQAYAPFLALRITCNLKTGLKSSENTICMELSSLNLLDSKTTSNMKAVLNHMQSVFAWTLDFYM